MPKIEQYLPIMQAFKTSKACESLGTTYRWSTFRDDESDEYWHRLLGATGRVDTHGKLMYQIARLFLKHENSKHELFSPDDEQIFLNGLLVHDWGEAVINGKGVGDVSAPHKTESDQKVESDIARRVIDSLDLPDDDKNMLITGYEQVVEAVNPQMYEAFRALEETEYVLTAMKVFQRCRERELVGLPGAKLELPLIGRVLVINLSNVLERHVPKFPNSIGRLFVEAAGLIDQMYAYSEGWLMENESWREEWGNQPELAQVFVQRWEAFKAEYRGC